MGFYLSSSSSLPLSSAFLPFPLALAREGGSGGVKMVNNITANFPSKTDTTICHFQHVRNGTSLWRVENPLFRSAPALVRQLAFTLLSTRFLFFILKPLKQPRITAEIIAGFIMNPDFLGTDFVFPVESFLVMETIANLGVVFHFFLVGLEIDLTMVMTTGKRAFFIAISGFLLPLALGLSSFIWLCSFDVIPSLMWALPLTVTGVHMVTRVVANLKLLHSDIGKLALSSAVANEIFVFVTLAVVIPLANDIKTSVLAIPATAAFVLFSIFLVRPAIIWMLNRCPEGGSLSEPQVCLILCGVLASAIATDACGCFSFVGAFVFGLVFPIGVHASEIMDKLEDLVSGTLVPLYFVASGIRINLDSLADSGFLAKVLLVVVLLSAAKIMSSLLLCTLYNMPLPEAIGLGLVSNTKDILALVILNIGRDGQKFDDQMFTVMAVAMLVMTGMVIPLTDFLYNSGKGFLRHNNRSIEKFQADGELRVLVCLHHNRNVPGIISLLQSSNPIPRSPLCVFAVHLVELTGRASAMLIVHNNQNAGTQDNPRSTQAQSEQTVGAFEGILQRNLDVPVQSFTIMSPYATMDEDICSIAEDERVNLAILPFHKHQTADGRMEEGNAGVRRFNQQVLENAACSVAVFVDRGLGFLDYDDRRICMLFFCGPDDREALSYSWRMAGHPNAMLNVIRFIPSENAFDLEYMEDAPGGILSAIAEHEKQKAMDDEFLENFRIRTSGDGNILYTEVMLNNGEETVTAVRDMDHDYDLYIVGRGLKVLSPLTAGLNEWSDCPELGAIGDMLVTSEFASKGSVLVIQQLGGAAAEPGSPDWSTHDFERYHWRQG